MLSVFVSTTATFFCWRSQEKGGGPWPGRCWYLRGATDLRDRSKGKDLGATDQAARIKQMDGTWKNMDHTYLVYLIIFACIALFFDADLPVTPPPKGMGWEVQEKRCFPRPPLWDGGLISMGKIEYTYRVDIVTRRRQHTNPKHSIYDIYIWYRPGPACTPPTHWGGWWPEDDIIYIYTHIYIISYQIIFVEKTRLLCT